MISALSRTFFRAGARATLTRVAMRFNSVNYKISTDSHVYKYLDKAPNFVKFTAQHEWIAVHEDATAFIGITNYAAEALGDATFVELPELGATYERGESIGGVESVKSASDIYSPVAGEVVGINDVLESKPQLINEDPMGAGWIAHIKLREPILAVESQEDLMDEAAYTQSLDD
ncbi:glycine cleavage system H protein [Metschnikowia bicuspidata]|uniref:Glycine cleavage system H protein n=1 Tax=Metschnikowia bicuspidata TaxID=27322 RepID=A0A4P9ZHP8_9ASCO|nr:glycine cleavage system H protein [Metschnikowia bicuspidata]